MILDLNNGDESYCTLFTTNMPISTFYARLDFKHGSLVPTRWKICIFIFLWKSVFIWETMTSRFYTERTHTKISLFKGKLLQHISRYAKRKILQKFETLNVVCLFKSALLRYLVSEQINFSCPKIRMHTRIQTCNFHLLLEKSSYAFIPG